MITEKEKAFEKKLNKQMDKWIRTLKEEAEFFKELKKELKSIT